MPSKPTPVFHNHSLSFGLICTALASLFALFFNSFDVDLNYWNDWVKQFQSGGYSALNANYPPLLLHWLWLVSKILNLLSIASDQLFILKLWTTLPVTLTHLLLTLVVGKILIAKRLNPHKQWIFWLTVFNPAILIDGPMWGQVDLLPFFPLLFALIFSFKNSKLIWVYPLFTLALLCKFQAIVLIPLLAGLTLRNYKEYKQHLTGIAISALIFCLGFLPFILQGQFIPAMERAYWGNLGMYQFSSMNAANLWYLLTNGSMHSDKIILFGARVAESGFDLWLTPAKLGLIFYVFSSALITFFAFKKGNLRNGFALATLSCLCFFTFSSAMHERYLFMAVPFALIWASIRPQATIWAILMTLAVYLNINFVLALPSSGAWNILSGIVVLSCFLMFFHSFFPQKFLAFTQSICQFQLANRIVFLGLFISQLSIFAIFVYKEIQKNRPIELHFPNSIKITDLKPIKATQAWSDLHFNTNVSSGELKINNHNCLFGLGTHAQSEITYSIPPEAKRIVGFAGLDIVGGASGEVNFIIQLDGQEKWSSGLVHAKDPLISYDLETQGAKELKLIVDALGNNAYDHSNWCETQFVKE